MLHPNRQFPDSLLKATYEQKIDYFNCGFILNHKNIDNVSSQLDSLFFNATEQQIALVVGPNGVGKSCLAHDIYRSLLEKKSDNNIPVVYLEAGVPGAGAFSWKYFYKSLLYILGELDSVKILGSHLSIDGKNSKSYSNKNRSENDLRQDLELRIKELNVSYILIDEIQHIFKYGGSNTERGLDVLKSISNSTVARKINNMRTIKNI